LRKSHRDSVVDAGNSNKSLRNWYAAGTHNATGLQVIADAMAAFNPNPTNSLTNHRVQQFDFAALA
jgi:hypothetical protein